MERRIESAEVLINIIEKIEGIYLYGAGNVSSKIIGVLDISGNKNKIKDVFVSKVDSESLTGFCDVHKFDVALVNKDFPIIIAVSDKYRDEIKCILEQNKLDNFFILEEKFEGSIKNYMLKVRVKNLRKEIDSVFLKENIDKVSDCHNDIVLFSPPYWDIYSPFSAVPCLKAKLEQEGYRVGQVDLGIISIHNLLENNWRNQADYLLSEQFYNERIKEIKGNFYSKYEIYKEDMWFLKENDKKIFPFKTVKENYYKFNAVQKRVLENFYDAIYYLDTSSIDFDTSMSIEKVLEEYTSINYYEVLCRKEVKNILKALPDIIGISIVSTCQFIPGCLLAKIIKANRPEIKIIFGGSCADLFIKSKYKNKADINKYFDYILIGEGETAITMLMKHIKKGVEIENVPNLVLIDKNGDVVYNELIIEDVYSLPVPDYSGLNLDLYLAPYPILPYQTSRGCHYGHCAFCNHDEKYRHNYRSKDMKTVVWELLYLSKKYNVNHFQFVDEAIRPDCFEIMVNEMDKHKEFKNIKWFYYSRVSRFYNKEILNLAKKNGCDMVMFGIETLNQRLLNFIKKGITAATSEYCLKSFHECGIKTYAWLMCNLPSETLDEVEKDYEQIKSLKQYISAISVGLFMLERNTDMYQNPDKYNILQINDEDTRLFVSHNNGNIIDKNEMFRFYYEKYLSLQSSWDFSGNRYTLFFEKNMSSEMDRKETGRRIMSIYRPLLGKMVRDAEGRLWFYDHRWLCIGNMESDLSDIKIVMQLKEEQVKQCGAAFELMIRGDILYISFMKRPELLVYNIPYHTYKLYENDIEAPLLSQQYSSIFYEDALIFIPADISKPICVFDMTKHQYTVNNEERYSGIIGNVYRFQNSRKLLLPVYNTNKLFVMKPDKLKGEFWELGDDISVNAIYGNEEDLWICQSDKKVIVNIKSGKASYISLTNENKEWRDPFSGIVKYEDKVIVLPRFAQHIYVIGQKNEVIKEIPVPYDKEEFEKRGCSLIYGYHLYNDTLYLFPWGLDETIELQLSNYQITKRELLIEKDDYCEYIYQPPIREIEENDLQNYIGWLTKH